jgi:hypothetical protein
MQWIDLANLQVRGLIGQRANLTFSRLDGKWYRPHEVFIADKKGWPGDWEGRAILAQTLLAQATHREPAWTDEIIDRIPNHLNKKGYFGPVCPDGVADEQQLSGHGWLLRGLIEYYKWRKDERVMKMIDKLLTCLYLPTRGLYAKYPIDPKERGKSKSWQLSQLQTKLKTHAKSIDTGCAFIALDGVTQAYELLRTPELKALIEEIIERYQKLDFIGLNIQTHATLSAVRGILRMYETTGDSAYLALGRKMFNMYKTEAWTENYANFNWFGRPRWTEPCAIIDSLIVAAWLWRFTQDAQYMEDMHYIFYNAIAHAHRASGGFGSSRCLGTEYVFLRVTTYEVYWCCTMRGGECWEKVYRFAFAHDDNTITVPFYHNCTATIPMGDGSVTLREKTTYPYEGAVEIEVLESSVSQNKTIKLFAPSWTRGAQTPVKVNGSDANAGFKNGFLSLTMPLKKGDTIAVDLGIGFHVKDTFNRHSEEGFHTFRHGPCILWCENPEIVRLNKDAGFNYRGMGAYEAKKDDMIVLSPIYDPYVFTQPDSMMQALFMPERTWV